MIDSNLNLVLASCHVLAKRTIKCHLSKVRRTKEFPQHLIFQLGQTTTDGRTYFSKSFAPEREFRHVGCVLSIKGKSKLSILYESIFFQVN